MEIRRAVKFAVLGLAALCCLWLPIPVMAFENLPEAMPGVWTYEEETEAGYAFSKKTPIEYIAMLAPKNGGLIEVTFWREVQPYIYHTIYLEPPPMEGQLGAAFWNGLIAGANAHAAEAATRFRFHYGASPGRQMAVWAGSVAILALLWKLVLRKPRPAAASLEGRFCGGYTWGRPYSRWAAR